MAFINDISSAIILTCNWISRSYGEYYYSITIILKLLSKNLLKGYHEFALKLMQRDKETYYDTYKE